MEAKGYMNFSKPSLSVVKTVGGFFRVEVHGVDSLQDGQTYAVMDIGRGPTKEAALADARQWFAGIQDRTPQEPEVDSPAMKTCDEIFQASLAVRQMALNLGWHPTQLVVAQQILQWQPQTPFVQDCLLALEQALKGEDGLGNVLASTADGLLRLAAKQPFELE